MPAPTGLNTVSKRLADGTVVQYFYNRAAPEGQRNLGTDRAVAEARLAEWRDAQATEKPSGAPTLGHLIAEYLASPQFTDMAPGTRRHYRRALDDLRERRLAELPVDRITPVMVKDWMKSKARTMANNHRSVLSVVLAIAVRDGHCITNAAAAIDRNPTDPRTTVWTEAHIDRFLAHAPTPSLRLAMALMLYTAQRPGDVLAMTRNRIRERGGRIFIGLRQQKTGELLDIPVHAKVVPYLRERLADNSGGLLLVPDPATGRQYHERTFARHWDNTCKAAGLSGLQRRDLRRTAVVNMAIAGLPVPQIAAVTGHRIDRTAQIIETYLPRHPGVALAAVEAWEAAGATVAATAL